MEDSEDRQSHRCALLVGKPYAGMFFNKKVVASGVPTTATESRSAVGPRIDSAEMLKYLELRRQAIKAGIKKGDWIDIVQTKGGHTKKTNKPVGKVLGCVQFDSDLEYTIAELVTMTDAHQVSALLVKDYAGEGFLKRKRATKSEPNVRKIKRLDKLHAWKWQSSIAIHVDIFVEITRGAVTWLWWNQDMAHSPDDLTDVPSNDVQKVATPIPAVPQTWGLALDDSDDSHIVDHDKLLDECFGKKCFGHNESSSSVGSARPVGNAIQEAASVDDRPITLQPVEIEFEQILSDDKIAEEQLTEDHAGNGMARVVIVSSSDDDDDTINKMMAGRVNTKVCESIEEANLWHEDFVRDLETREGEDGINRFANALQTMTFSTECSGIEAPIVARNMLCLAVSKKMDSPVVPAKVQAVT